MVAGRSSEGRAVTGVTKTSGLATIGAPANSFEAGDVGRTIVGTGIPAAATIIAVASPTAATMSANATDSATVTVTLGAHRTLQNAQGFVGWSPETEAERKVHSRAGGGGATAPTQVTGVLTSTHTRRARG